MNFQAFVVLSAIMLGPGLLTPAAESNGATRSSGTVAISELSSQINRLATDRFGDTTIAPFAKEQLTSFWEHFTDSPEVESVIASRITAVWTRPAETTDKTYRSLQSQDFLGRVWQTYHCLVVNRQPLSGEENNRRTGQVRKLAAMLDQLDEELLKGNAELPPEFLVGLRSEVDHSIARLKEHADSPAYPLLYRPLSDADFEKVVIAVRADYADRISRFLQVFPNTATEVEQSSKVKDKSSRQHLYKTRWKEKGATFAALATGSIMRHYGLLGRNLDYTNTQLFPPFMKVNGAGLSYRMSDGVSMRLSIDQNI